MRCVGARSCECGRNLARTSLGVFMEQAGGVNDARQLALRRLCVIVGDRGPGDAQLLRGSRLELCCLTLQPSELVRIVLQRAPRGPACSRSRLKVGGDDVQSLD